MESCGRPAPPTRTRPADSSTAAGASATSMTSPGKWVVGNLNGAGGFLLGRHTYRASRAHWPNASEEEQPLAQPLNTRPKYVASTALTDPLEWQNSTVLKGDVAGAVAEL